MADVKAIAEQLVNLTVKEVQELCSKLQEEINLLGPVNLAAIRDLTSEKERKGYLDSQVEDLTSASNTLEDAIKRIDKETRDRLIATFNEVNKNFTEFFKVLFNGGQAKLELLGEDIFKYFGLGCRSVSKLFIPKDYNFHLLFNALYKFKDIINYKKYENNYDYNKAVYIMSLFNVLENGFVMLKEDKNYASPIATVFYEFYSSFENLKQKLSKESEEIQCIACNENVVDFVKLGQTQHPKLWDYADNIDTIKFLLKLFFLIFKIFFLIWNLFTKIY